MHAQGHTKGCWNHPVPHCQTPLGKGCNSWSEFRRALSLVPCRTDEDQPLLTAATQSERVGATYPICTSPTKGSPPPATQILPLHFQELRLPPDQWPCATEVFWWQRNKSFGWGNATTNRWCCLLCLPSWNKDAIHTFLINKEWQMKAREMYSTVEKDQKTQDREGTIQVTLEPHNFIYLTFRLSLASWYRCITLKRQHKCIQKRTLFSTFFHKSSKIDFLLPYFIPQNRGSLSHTQEHLNLFKPNFSYTYAHFQGITQWSGRTTDHLIFL